MPKPVAVQLYSVREALEQDFVGVIKQIALMGYVGVEPAGFKGSTAETAAKLFRSLGLQVPSAHIRLPLGDDKAEVLDTMALLGAQYLVCAFIPRDQFGSVDQIKGHCDRLNEANANARAAGLTLVYHNHNWEYELINGVYPYQVMLENLDPTIKFELDTYWIQTAGRNPVDVIQELGDRAPLLHIKDGPAVVGEPMVAAGEGVIDIPAIVEAGTAAEWLVVELDNCATDMLTAVDSSYRYLVGKGLARGNKA